MTFFRRRARQTAASSEDGSVYRDLRRQVLTLNRRDLALEDDGQPVLALLMETGYPEAVATLVGVADGSTSLYFSSGGGVIGAGEHPDVAGATRSWLDLCGELLPLLSVCEGEPALPAEGDTQFVAVTTDGLRSASAPEVELGEERHRLSPLFHAGHEVITRVRLVEESRGS